MLNDEIVEEVMAIREAHAEKFNFDLRAIYDDLKKSEAKHIAGGHPYITPPTMPVKPNTTFQRTRFARR